MVSPQSDLTSEFIVDNLSEPSLHSTEYSRPYRASSLPYTMNTGVLIKGVSIWGKDYGK